jgi:hypothetical protein
METITYKGKHCTASEGDKINFFTNDLILDLTKDLLEFAFVIADFY